MTPHAGAEWRAWPGTAGSHHVPPPTPLTLKQCPETLWTQSPVCGPGPDGGRPSPGTLCMFSELQPSETCLAPVKNHEQIASGETAHKHCFLQNTGNTHGGITPQGSKTCVQCQGAQGSHMACAARLGAPTSAARFLNGPLETDWDPGKPLSTPAGRKCLQLELAWPGNLMASVAGRQLPFGWTPCPGSAGSARSLADG